jgi:cation diffusion facilitator CzcD-associated flavoprotein CzcO
LHHLYTSDNAKSIQDREDVTAHAIEYMKTTSPKKYHEILIPKFPLGCKRRIFDPDYLEALHSPNIELTTEPIVEFTEHGLRTTKRDLEFDAVVLSTGFKIQDFLHPISVTGKGGVTLEEHWKSTRGAQAYKSTFVTGFPNFAIVFGPNSFP